ncbi:hypothetical protein UCYN_09460 [Candidatus Atelocyanobacterium thalassa isolate ALOHA]|uniref:Uncharacterized protein n=1 Tax=Atelocyanobacterium thalassa (isolate ALOHA) TaxID=1453429 RepID=D3EQ76_ATETH|nr:hypothetical protein UCYN_09460 [Candidatus Atelocyanobacterium thalassa isolate ALOHA]
MQIKCYALEASKLNLFDKSLTDFKKLDFITRFKVSILKPEVLLKLPKKLGLFLKKVLGY